MSVAKVIEVISGSTISIEDAVQVGVSKAAETVSGIQNVWIKDIKAQVTDGKVGEWRVNMALTFVLKD